MATKQKIGIFGTGDVGQTLGAGFLRHGYQVMLAGREKTNEKGQKWAAEKGAQYGTFADAAKFADIIVLATLWAGTENAIKSAGAENIKGKIIIDVTNPLDFSSGKPKLAVGFSTSGGELVQSWAPESHVVKTWNIINCNFMIDPDFNGDKPTMFYCGNNADAKKVVHDILVETKWESIFDHGDLTSARLLEPLAMLWIQHGVLGYGWT
eukprot:CAMPEP_0168551700 /NCGR_PEP_ID=MMETSP0413-20121227/6318_1 /TAXON_ID=136452 /ORGANISM="Filamoeba nolandi, Strain NC-AS-23-1" /LENGTH=208 /DNA_ID=CAMNT_0008582255 /DNA_START=52 /DNA_END=675 /DNA_ORIENTATION=-